MGSTHQDTMCSTHKAHMAPAALLLLALAVGVHGGGIGGCNEGGGTCVNTPAFLRVVGDPVCYEANQIHTHPLEMKNECAEGATCCKLGKVKYLGKRECDATSTPKRCEKRHGGKCQGECDTIAVDGECKGASCTCCVQKAEDCKPKKKHKSKNGFCVRKRKHCKKSGGEIIMRGCRCRPGPNKHLCYVEKFKWCYLDEDCGPDAWADHYPQCGMERQSPIDIDTETATAGSTDPFVFNLYDRTPNSIDLLNNGHSVTVYWNDGAKPFISGGGLDDKYILAQFHFHWGADSSKGSEHTIDETAYPMELHLVHYRASYGSLGEAVKHSDGLAVLGVMYEVSATENEDTEALDDIVEALTEVVDTDDSHNAQYGKTLNALLPDDTSKFFRYLGSLTTPSCNEVVIWTVFEEPVSITEAQLEEFRSLLDHKEEAIVDNFRPVQDLNGRTVTYYTTS